MNRCILCGLRAWICMCLCNWEPLSCQKKSLKMSPGEGKASWNTQPGQERGWILAAEFPCKARIKVRPLTRIYRPNSPSALAIRLPMGGWQSSLPQTLCFPQKASLAPCPSTCPWFQLPAGVNKWSGQFAQIFFPFFPPFPSLPKKPFRLVQGHWFEKINQGWGHHLSVPNYCWQMYLQEALGDVSSHKGEAERRGVSSSYTKLYT